MALSAGVASFVEAGLQRVPGVIRARLDIWPEQSDQELHQEFGPPGTERFWLETLEARYGRLDVVVSDADAFAPYAPYVSNLANAIALHAESMRQRERLERLVGETRRLNAELMAAADERERIAAGHHFLAQASRVLGSSLEARASLERLAEMAARHFDAVCIIDELEPGDAPVQAAIAHPDPALASTVREVRQRMSTWPLTTDQLGQVLRTRVPLCVAAPASGDADRALSLLPSQLPSGSSIVLPMCVRDSAIGVLSLVSGGSELDANKVRVAEDFAARLALALENARLFQRTRAMVSDLQAANAELESFSHSVSHDLRAPLRAIEGLSQILLKHYPGQLDARGDDYLTRIRAAAVRMGILIEELLQLSRFSRAPVHREWVDLAAAADGIISGFRQAFPDRKVEVQIERPLLAWADGPLIEAALANLLENAWKFTARREPAHIRFGSYRHSDERVFVVQDDGVGFDMRFATNLFRAFQRMHAQEEFPGTGIGLATVRRILQRHGGEICADAEPGKGAAFYFTLGLQPALPEVRSRESSRSDEA